MLSYNIPAWESQLTHRLRVLLHTEPLLGLRQGDAYRSLETRHYDSLTLALKIFDRIVESTGLEHDVDSQAIKNALEPLLVAMDEAENLEPDAERHHFYAEQLLIRLLNDEDRGRPFKIEYTDFEAGRAIARQFEMRLLQEYYHPDGRIVLRLSNEAANIFLNALDLEIEDAQAAAEAVVKSQLERGRFDEAVESARDARFQSIRLEEKIERVLKETQRDLSKVDWREAIPILLSEALEHIDTRFEVEQHIVNSAHQKLESLLMGSEEAKQVAIIKDLIDDCFQRHVQLHHHLLRARGIFLNEQERQSFVTQRPLHLPHMLSEVLEPLLSLPKKKALLATEESLIDLLGAYPPERPSLTRIITWLLRPRRELLLSEVPVVERDLYIADTDPERYTDAIKSTAELYLSKLPCSLSTLLDQADQAQETNVVLEYLAIKALRLFSHEEDPMRKAERIEGDVLSTAGFYGNDLQLFADEETP